MQLYNSVRMMLENGPQTHSQASVQGPTLTLTLSVNKPYGRICLF